jgi:tRNA1Val (adenine37-N6)-methyltransferase
MHPSRDIFVFRHFSLSHANATMKVGTDAMILGAWAPLMKSSARLLDIGTGSGVLALMMAQRSNAWITAIDIDAESIREAQANFSNSRWAERLEAKQIALQDFSETETENFDCIISNPPFFQNSLLPGNDRYKIAKHTTSLTFEEFFSCSSRLLSDRGNLAVIVPFNNKQQLFDIAAGYELYPKQILTVFPSVNKIPHRLIASFYREKQSEIHSSEITIRNAKGEYSTQYKQLTQDFHAEGYL